MTLATFASWMETVPRLLFFWPRFGANVTRSQARTQLWEDQVDAGGTAAQMTSQSSGASNSGCCSAWLPLAKAERWYVARTLPQRELQAATQLKNQDFRAFVPRYWKNRRHARKVETISAPLFPRYLFVILNRSVDRWRSINGTLGVERLLMQGGEPLPVPHGVVESLVEAADGGGNVHFDADLKEGQRVKVIAGVFAEFVGQLERLDDNGRVRVLLEIMGGKVRVAIPQSLLAPTRDVA